MCLAVYPSHPTVTASLSIKDTPMVQKVKICVMEVFFMKKQIKVNIKRLALSAMLTAMSVIIGIFCKTVLNFADGLFRITFENLPILISGIFFGPVVGGVVGIGSDLISYLLSPQTFPPNLVVTFGACMVGVVSGVISRFVVKKHGPLQFIIAGGCAHIVGSMIIKPIGLFVFYNWLVLWRIPLYLVIAPIEISIICLMYKHSSIKRLFDTTRID